MRRKIFIRKHKPKEYWVFIESGINEYIRVHKMFCPKQRKMGLKALRKLFK